ncbi:helicase associated domain-containing protein [Rhodococcus opacus]|uniref:helicase associated domain-containing protein n=1 Tax=Rhodococcus opacus TaxID=37919 RepID=UPI0029C479ED|nr:helicase associated domain-containing protein [Rhodococcus opacus]MDX5962428.1 helicase associated domain-containing protein [Rhodococcus opacus]
MTAPAGETGRDDSSLVIAGELARYTARADRWEEGFRRLLAYVEHHGHARVPQSHTVDGYQLGKWVNTQRTHHVKGTLDTDRERRLQELTGWTWDPIADRWEEGFRRLLAYVEHHGHARVPQSHTVDGYQLGKWITAQRHNHAEGTLDTDRERRLQELTGWTWDPIADRWEEGFRQLLAYVEHHGHAHVPRSDMIDDHRLGHWVNKQRAVYANGTLDTDRERRLQELTGWTWDPIADRWEEGFRRLLAYVEHHGHARVPQSHTVDGYQLGKWITAQRHNHAEGTLDTDRERRLQELTGWTWDPIADRWEEGFSQLLAYVEHHGHARVPQSYTVDGYRLGKWVNKQRSQCTAGTLDVGRERRLQELPGWTWNASPSAEVRIRHYDSETEPRRGRPDSRPTTGTR